MPYDHGAIYRRFLDEIASTAVGPETATAFWREQGRLIAADARVGSPHDFLRWPSLEPFSAPESWIPQACYDALRDRPDWASRWFPLTRDTKVGGPKDYGRDLGTSPILVQHAYHLMRYEQDTGRALTECDVIVEIGGGYGSFCRLLRNAGFEGLHVIYDLPHVSAIQRLYLGLSGFTEVSPAQVARRTRHGVCLVTDDGLDAVHAALADQGLTVGFVATWSLSEAPMSVRDRIFPRFHPLCTRYLIAYQPYWDRIDNGAYFGALCRDRPDLTWRTEQMPRVADPPSLYLFA
ncbi:hypothetical protein DK419_21770 [Methylobacterium terrae]|uniref:Sugar O-methyltransferase n=1 Tax=Methylobacterium terrae TaxID=2202827 RepID=A0A2U8WTC3_9HYPH|nr:hypothetical protein [Methylobacterium terrae]AWN48660.1 hypothetical protein DK419_21770 [Methylobacterium terrae]